MYNLRKASDLLLLIYLARRPGGDPSFDPVLNLMLIAGLCEYLGNFMSGEWIMPVDLTVCNRRGCSLGFSSSGVLRFLALLYLTISF